MQICASLDYRKKMKAEPSRLIPRMSTENVKFLTAADNGNFYSSNRICRNVLRNNASRQEFSPAKPLTAEQKHSRKRTIYRTPKTFKCEFPITFNVKDKTIEALASSLMEVVIEREKQDSIVSGKINLYFAENSGKIAKVGGFIMSRKMCSTGKIKFSEPIYSLFHNHPSSL